MITPARRGSLRSSGFAHTQRHRERIASRGPDRFAVDAPRDDRCDPLHKRDNISMSTSQIVIVARRAQAGIASMKQTACVGSLLSWMFVWLFAWTPPGAGAGEVRVEGRTF